jgi:hypothetical protein
MQRTWKKDKGVFISLMKVERALRALTPYDCGGGIRSAIPCYIPACESHYNFHAVNPSSGAGGFYQFLPSTWQALGGRGLPQYAPPIEQHRLAAKYYAMSGGSPWVCG